MIFQWFFIVFVNNHVFQKISLQEPSWTELGPTWVDFGTQNGAKMAPKTGQKSNIKKRQKKVRKRPSRKTCLSKNGKRARVVRTLKHLLPFGCSWVPFCCSWLPFGALGCLLGALGCLLGASWGLLGASWGALGRLLGSLGRSWAPLGASWGGLAI